MDTGSMRGKLNIKKISEELLGLVSVDWDLYNRDLHHEKN